MQNIMMTQSLTLPENHLKPQAPMRHPTDLPIARKYIKRCAAARAKNSTKGFTLIELSIVLVIIALITGGVLVGNDLLKMAQARGVMSQMERYETAIRTFQLKYNCLPGDCLNASTFGLGTSGNGDKLIGNTTNSYPGGSLGGCVAGGGGAWCNTQRRGPGNQIYRPYGEAQRLWSHLSAAELLDGEYQELASSTDPTSNLSAYFPTSDSGKTHLIAFMWNRLLYIRTGFTNQNQWETAFFQTAALDAGQMQYIHGKFGYETILADLESDNFPTAMAQNRRVIPLAQGCGNSSCGYYSDVYLRPDRTNTKRCAISDGAGGYKFNIQGTSECNMLWQAYP